MTQNNLGNALLEMGRAGKRDAKRLEEAVAAYRAALEEHTREGSPADWAMTQNNLGNALLSLGERESGTRAPRGGRRRPTARRLRNAPARARRRSGP